MSNTAEGEEISTGTSPMEAKAEATKETAAKADNDTTSGISAVQVKDLRWIIQGNIAVPTGNPFHPDIVAEYDSRQDEDNDILWLGPGLKILLDHVVAVSLQGIIVWMATTRDSQAILDEQETLSAHHDHHCEHLLLESPYEFLCPGMIDLHIHAPQFAYTGTATDRPLMGPEGWLETYTFPAERRLKDDPELTRQVYEGVVQTTLNNGTTTAVYFGTLHLKPNETLVDVCLDAGQRALVGKVCMDRHGPDDYLQSLEENIDETKSLIQYIQNHPENKNKRLPLILPLITPRFLPTCTPELLSALGKLAQEYKCHVTSHVSESIDEVEWSQQLAKQEQQTHQDGSNDEAPPTDSVMFQQLGLLTNQCIMAHGVHLTDDDVDLLRQQGSAIAHCPMSNFFFAGGVFPCRHFMERQNKVGLATDVAGGYSPSMLNAARMAVVASQVLQAQQQQQQQQQQSEEDSSSAALDYRHAIYLATLGGAEALGMEHQIGTFRIGMEFDAIVLSAGTAASTTNIRVFPEQDKLADVFQKLWVLGDDRNITSVFVNGWQVKEFFG